MRNHKIVRTSAPENRKSPEQSVTVSRDRMTEIIRICREWVEAGMGAGITTARRDLFAFLEIPMPTHSTFELFVTQLISLTGVAVAWRLIHYLGMQKSNTLTIKDLEPICGTRTLAKQVVALGVQTQVLRHYHSYWMLEPAAKVFLFRSLEAREQ